MLTTSLKLQAAIIGSPPTAGSRFSDPPTQLANSPLSNPMARPRCCTPTPCWRSQAEPFCWARAPDGRRWVATMGGLVEWPSGPPTPSNFRIHSTERGLTDSQIYALATDVTGDLWMGTRRGGIMRVIRTRFQTFGPADGLVTSGS